MAAEPSYMVAEPSYFDEDTKRTQSARFDVHQPSPRKDIVGTRQDPGARSDLPGGGSTGSFRRIATASERLRPAEDREVDFIDREGTSV